nr:helitron helicase-like domain-containing protein [Tanacetum cinerariifolium]
MRRKHENEFTNGGFNEFQKQTVNILNHVETFATFDALDNVLSGYGPRCDVPSVGDPLASCYSRITGLYLDVSESVLSFVLYLDMYRKYSRVSRKVSCVQQGTGLRGGGLDKRKLQPRGHSDILEAYLALCSSGASSRRSISLSQITPVFNSNLVHTDFSSLYGPSASLPGRSFHANTNAVMITGRLDRVDSQNSYLVSRDGGYTRENCQLRSTIGVSNNGSSASRRGTSYTYSDLGDCDRRCRYCGDSFWYVKRLKGHSHNQTPEYHLCCGGGRIQMQPPREPPECIKSLFENKHFMENIRSYNQMFAMTSFGAKIDESINVARGLYVFKISGQIYHWIGSLCPPAGEPPSQLEPGIVEGLIHFLDSHDELVQLFQTTRDKCRELDILEFKMRLYNAEGERKTRKRQNRIKTGQKRGS